ncbi:MAG: acetyl-CoA carboxylase, carboxyltransferase subunit beta [Candidatus Eremiobacteraeota bacterium]|nr:acetyl-CoA carboxylase, carboxyltransferase subunit beta [Candidatus Eremiobacteraeota bacterium]
MSSFFDKLRLTKPKLEKTGTIKSGKPKVPGDLWVKCKGCDTPIYRKVLEEKLKVCDKCGFHHKMTSFERLALLTDPGSFEEMDSNIFPVDPLDFGEEFQVKLARDQKKTGLNDALLTGTATIEGHKVVAIIMEFFFRGGSMGSVVGEKVTRALEYAAEHKLPAIMVTCSGGARMQEGVFSLMQLVKTNAAVIRLGEAKAPYIVIMTDPTTAGVAASYAAIGDVILAEPGAIIGFSGRRVIEQTIRQKLPADFQTSEFYMKHGFIDRVIHRRILKRTLERILNFYSNTDEKEQTPEKEEA